MGLGKLSEQSQPTINIHITNYTWHYKVYNNYMDTLKSSDFLPQLVFISVQLWCIKMPLIDTLVVSSAINHFCTFHHFSFTARHQSACVYINITASDVASELRSLERWLLEDFFCEHLITRPKEQEQRQVKYHCASPEWSPTWRWMTGI